MTEPLSVKVREAAELTGISQDRLRNAIRAGELDVKYPYRGKRNYVILMTSLRQWLSSQPDEPGEP